MADQKNYITPQGHAALEAEFTQLLKVERPELEAEQRQGRALLWDTGMDAQFQAQAQAARVAQQPYVYQTKA